MTTNKPEVKRYNITTDKYDHPVPYETEHGYWVKHSSYKSLQTECDKLRRAAAECAEYLNYSKYTAIHHGSLLHKMLIDAARPNQSDANT